VSARRKPGTGRPGLPGYLRMLAHAVHKEPLSLPVLGAVFGFHRDSADDILNSFHAAGLTYISGWYRAADRGPHMPEFSMRLGDEAPAPYPGGRQRRRAQHRARAETIVLRSFIEALRAGPMTVRDLVEHTGLCRGTVQTLVKLACALKLAYVAEWPPSTHLIVGPRMPAYSFGINRKPVAKPLPIPRDELYRRYYEHIKQRRKQASTLRAIAGAADLGDMRRLSGVVVNAHSFKQQA
jgi:hypothetical protein